MECKHCNSTWNSSQTVTNCPFCGKYILTETNDNMNLPEGIQSIVSEYGIEILNDSKRLISLIMDYVRDCEKEKKLFRIACNCGIPKAVLDIKSCADNQRELLIKKAIKKLEDEAFFSTENAEYIISLILIGVGITYKPSKEETQVSHSPITTTTQTVKAKVSSNPVNSNSSTSTVSNEERLKNIVLSNLAVSQEDRDDICEMGRKMLMNRSFDEGFKFVQYAAKKGSMNGAILLGYCYDVGLGVKQDKKIAEAYYRQGTISNPEFKSYYQQKYGIGRGLFDAAAKAAEKMLKTTYMPNQAPVVQKTSSNNQAPEKKAETIQQTSTSFFQSFKDKIFGSEKDKESLLWTIVNENRRPTKEESGAILNLGRRLLKNGNSADGIKLIKFTAQYGYDYGSLLLGYCYDKGIGVTKDTNVAMAYYGRAGVSGSADASYKKYSWDDATHLSRARSVAEKIYNERI